MNVNLQYQAGEEDSGTRLDKLLCTVLPELTRSYIQKIARSGGILVNGHTVKTGYALRAGDEICMEIPPAEPLSVEPQDIPLDILYEDDQLLVINKPKGMVVHPGAGHPKDTLVNALLYHCGGELSGINGVLRPGIVHRIDRDTTGSLVVCKTDSAHQFLSEQFAVHSITRTYRAIVLGHPPEEGTVCAPIGRHPTDRKKMSVHCRNGKEAVTHYRVLEQLKKYAYIECRLETGRTHQIRVHMASIGHPILGDPIYGSGVNTFSLSGQTLHAMRLGFIHPKTHTYMEFEAPLPAYFTDLLQKLR